MVSHKIYRIGRCCRYDPIVYMWTPPLNRGSLFVKGHNVVAGGQPFHQGFSSSSLSTPHE